MRNRSLKPVVLFLAFFAINRFNPDDLITKEVYWNRFSLDYLPIMYNFRLD